ncbi:MAG: Sec-independent protein translocase protein TatB [Pseudolabrys sp.]|nr:Sec-independent protein translocase protein TatB [Pseudolabrys sp.]MDP2296297.1 Sec-independent protein translocase protein TatB [Pseudolabrys sp.]
MFNFGWGELLLIGIVALIAIGPKELPTVLRSVGQMLGKVRRMANEFQGQFQEAIREADIADLKKHADDIVSDVTKYDPLTETTKEIEKSFVLPDPLAEPSGSPTSSTEALPAPGEQVTDGATLPAGVLPAIDVPLPDAPEPLTEKDFAVADKPAETPAAAPASDEPIKQAGAQGVKA